MKRPGSGDAPFLFHARKRRTYAWCACGLSKKQPLCDGTHTGSGKQPVLFSVAEDTELVLCGCKATHAPPYCDGTHLKR